MAAIYCSNCGKHIGTQSNFCPYCGAVQHGPQAAVYRAQEPAQAEPVTPEDAHEAIQSTTPDTIRRRHLSPAAVWSFFFNYLAATAMLLLLLAVAIVFAPVIASAVLIAYIVAVFFVASVIHQSFTFEINDRCFRKDYGVMHKRHVSIPFQQIQNVNINRSVMDRILGIAKIDIETAGSGRIKPREIVGGSKTKAEGSLPGIALADAMVIHDLLLQRASESHGNGNGNGNGQ